MKRMKLVSRTAVCLCFTLVGVVGIGCARTDVTDGDSHAETSAAHWHFTEGRGVGLDEQGETVIGIELAEVTFSEEDALEVPLSSLLQTVRGTFVYVQNGDYYFRSPVQVGQKSSHRVTITDGLFDGDVIASKGAQMLWLTELQSINGGAACTHSH